MSYSPKDLCPVVSGFRTTCFGCLEQTFLFFYQICWKLVTSWISSVQANPLRVIAQIFEIPWFWSSLTARNAFVSEISDTKLRWAVCQQSGAGHTFSGKRTVVGVGVVWRGVSQLHVGSEFMKKDLLLSEIQSETCSFFSESTKYSFSKKYLVFVLVTCL